MSHNVKIKYYARENVQMKPHSLYAQAIANGTYGFDRMCEEAAINTGMEPEAIRQAVVLYTACAKRKLLDGFKVEIGKNFLTLGPSLSARVKDEVDETGKVVKVAKASDLTAVGAKSRVSCTIDTEFVHEFARSVKWQKSDRAGNVIDPGEGEDATLDPDDPTQPNAGGNNAGGNNAGGNQPSQGGGGNTGGGEPSQGGGGNTGSGDEPME